MLIGRLNQRVEILELQEERDSFGAVVGKWKTVQQLWANIKPGIGSEHLTNQQVEGDENCIITIRFNPAVNKTHRLRYGSKTYEIVGVRDDETDHRWTIITAKEIENGNLLCETTENQDQD